MVVVVSAFLQGWSSSSPPFLSSSEKERINLKGRTFIWGRRSRRRHRGHGRRCRRRLRHCYRHCRRRACCVLMDILSFRVQYFFLMLFSCIVFGAFLLFCDFGAQDRSNMMLRVDNVPHITSYKI